MHLDFLDLEVTGAPLSTTLNVQPYGYPGNKEAKSAFFRALQPGGTFKTSICVLKIEKIFPASEKNCVNFYALANFYNNSIKEKKVQGKVYFNE
jgi:hypothetical protein